MTSSPDDRTVLVCTGVLHLGDLLCTTPAVRALRKLHPHAFLSYVVPNAEYCTVLERNPDIDLVIYREDLREHGAALIDGAWCDALPLPRGAVRMLHHFDLTTVHARGPSAFLDHAAVAFGAHVGVAIDSVRPVVQLTERERAVARELARPPYLVFGMHAASPVLGHHGRMARKEWVVERWLQLAQLVSAMGNYDVVAVGGEDDDAVPSRRVRSLHALPIRVVAALLQEAACVVTVDSGLSHLAHAVDAPMVVICSSDVPFAWANPREATRCRVIHRHPSTITTDEVARAVRSILAATRND